MVSLIWRVHLKSRATPTIFNFVHFNAKARGVDGLAAKSANIDGSFVRFEDIVVGGTYNLEFDERGYVLAFEPVKG